MKAITIWQPWASLIMAGAKPYEFRPESYLNRRSYGTGPEVDERVVIAAAARRVKPAEVDDLLRRIECDEKLTGMYPPRTGLLPSIARPVLERCRAAAKYQALPLGCGLGTAVLGKPLNAGTLFGGTVADSDRAAADEQAYNWAWPLRDITPFDAPIPMRGAQGFWMWPDGASV